ncbi:hypothetical protein WDW86_10305 [Bdellovibrionota bacterium FG-2]
MNLRFSIKPGKDGESLHEDSKILRVVAADNMDADIGKINPKALELSTADKASSLPHLSAFEDSLTTPEQSIVLSGKEKIKSLVCGLEVRAVRASRPIPDSKPEYPSLEVQWFEATVDGPGGAKVKDTRPGADGHCGIIGMNWGGKSKLDKELRNSLRSQLADLAAKDIRLKKF